MRDRLAAFNTLSAEEAAAELLKCCGSRMWAHALAAHRPFDSEGELLETADQIWWALGPEDWLEAFSHHPKIGEKRAAPKQSLEAARWSAEEQAAVAKAAEEKLEKLAHLNRVYLDRFGFIFIVCATGKTTEEMLALLEERLGNEPEMELRIAAEEQRRITHLRLRKLLQL
ncbi:MAG TPA: 2-oxo-4-hydroxy-4-carboxy-5-ureidoimidazoline decarboxylase [Pyrinomonadaceae bacterium]|jgi:OHCU decarboxylase